MVFGFSPAKKIGLMNCPKCGIQTHNRSMMGKLHPLTRPGLVENGICLNCSPATTDAAVEEAAVKELIDKFLFPSNPSSRDHAVPSPQSLNENDVTFYTRINDCFDNDQEDDTDDRITVSKGTLKFPGSDETYVGDYTKYNDDTQSRHGKGMNIYPNGSVYDGEWMDDKKHGHGVMTWYSVGEEGDKEQYIGEWKEDMPHGEGTIICAGNVNVYEGSFLNGKMHGHGVYTERDGSITYVGGWKYGKMHGHGVFTVRNADNGDGGGCDSAIAIYTGNFSDGMANGHGEFTWPTTGATYVGEWGNDLRHGKGKHTFSNGSVYNGEWHDDKRHGYGEMTYIDVAEYVGEWNNHRRNGHGLMIFQDGRVYDGPWKDGWWNGE